MAAFAEHCEFGVVLEDMLRDRLVCTINDDGIQRRLLREATLTFKRAFDVAQAMETATNNTNDIKNANSVAQPGAVHFTSKETRGKPPKSVEC